MYIKGKTDTPDGWVLREGYVDCCGHMRYMYTCAYGGYRVMMSGYAMPRLLRGERYEVEEFRRRVKEWETARKKRRDQKILNLLESAEYELCQAVDDCDDPEERELLNKAHEATSKARTTLEKIGGVWE